RQGCGGRHATFEWPAPRPSTIPARWPLATPDAHACWMVTVVSSADVMACVRLAPFTTSSTNPFVIAGGEAPSYQLNEMSLQHPSPPGSAVACTSQITGPSVVRGCPWTSGSVSQCAFKSEAGGTHVFVAAVDADPR